MRMDSTAIPLEFTHAAGFAPGSIGCESAPLLLEKTRTTKHVTPENRLLLRAARNEVPYNLAHNLLQA